VAVQIHEMADASFLENKILFSSDHELLLLWSSEPT
jgi:hypothetical protein